MKNSREKGHGFERDVCKILNKAFKITGTKYKFQRVPMSGGFDKQNFPGDVFSTHKSLELALEFSIECKFHKEWKLEDLVNGNKANILEWWKQCTDDAKIGDKMPLLLFKKNNSKIYFMMMNDDGKYLIPSGSRSIGPLLFTTTPSGYVAIGLFDNLLPGMVEDFKMRNK